MMSIITLISLLFASLHSLHASTTVRQLLPFSEEETLNSEQLSSRQLLGQRRFAIIVANYNTKPWYRKTLDSLLNQQYDNFYILFIDDGDDGVGYAAQAYAQEKGHGHRFVLIKNNYRHYKALNIYNVIHQHVDDHDVVAICDGDDWWYGPQVLEYLNDKYQQGYWLTWGGFIRYPENKIAHQFQVPANVIQENSFRQNCHLCLGAALRSFEAWLFKQIPLEEFFYEGILVRTTGDMAKMFPMYEMAGEHIWLNDEILYVCNTKNPLSDHRIARHMQADVMQYILKRPPLPRREQRSPAPSRLVAREQASVVIIANEQTTPETITNLLEHYTDIATLIIIADQLKPALANASFAYPTQFITGNNIQDQLRMAIQEGSTNYCFFIDAQKLPSRLPLSRLNEYIQLLETTKAYGFYLKWDQPNERRYIGEQIFDRYLAWQFSHNKKNQFGNAHSLNHTLYRTKQVLSILNQCSAADSEQLWRQWQEVALTNKTAIGVGILL